MSEQKITILSMIAGTGSSFFVVLPMAFIIAFATGFCGVLGQFVARWIIRKIDKKNRYKFK